MAILVIAVLTATVGASFMLSGNEVIAATTQRGQQRAFTIAQSALEQFIVRRQQTGFCPICMANNPVRPTLPESTQIAFPGGFAWVVARPIRATTETVTGLFLITSRGVDTTTPIGGGSRLSRAERTVAQYATWNPLSMNVVSSWTSLSGVNKAGISGDIVGHDNCPSGSGGGASSLPGVTVPTGTYSGSTGGVVGATPPIDSVQSLDALRNNVGIDWRAIQNGAVTADYTVNNSSQWPTAALFALNPNTWFVIRVRYQDANPPLTFFPGRGIIIADSNFVMNGNEDWKGILLVGGKLDSNGNNANYGATLSGLNLLLNNNPIPQSTQNGAKSFFYHSCNVRDAASRLSSYMVVQNAWMDNIAGW